MTPSSSLRNNLDKNKNYFSCFSFLPIQNFFFYQMPSHVTFLANNKLTLINHQRKPSQNSFYAFITDVSFRFEELICYMLVISKAGGNQRPWRKPTGNEHRLDNWNTRKLRTTTTLFLPYINKHFNTVQKVRLWQEVRFRSQHFFCSMLLNVLCFFISLIHQKA